MILVEIEVIIAFIAFQWIEVLFARVNIGELLTIEEVDLSHRRNHQSARLRTGNRVGTIICQSVRGIEVLEDSRGGLSHSQ